MGIDYDGGMVVGESGDTFDRIALENLSGEEHSACFYLTEMCGMSRMSPWFDADFEDCIYGFSVPDIEVDKIDDNWIKEIKEKAKKFEEITGVKARLIGTQNIY